MSALLSNIELLGAAGCPYVQRSVALLVQHKIPFKYTQVDLYNKPQWLASKSPLLKVPALVFEGGDKPTLFESVCYLRDVVFLITIQQVINEFIEDSLPADQRIVPSDPYTRATVCIYPHSTSGHYHHDPSPFSSQLNFNNLNSSYRYL